MMSNSYKMKRVPNSERLGKGPLTPPLACTSLCPRTEQALFTIEIMKILGGDPSAASATDTFCFSSIMFDNNCFGGFVTVSLNQERSFGDLYSNDVYCNTINKSTEISLYRLLHSNLLTLFTNYTDTSDPFT